MYKHFFKRLIDICVALVCLPFFVIIFIFVALAIYLTDKGPVFYNAERCGKDAKFFKMYKFRSMHVSAPDIRTADGSTFNSASDPRVTKIGRILRTTSLDETPQILNVLRGDMSIVGPRAFLNSRRLKLAEMDEKRQKRLAVRPGITGYSQAYYRNSISLEEKIDYDCYYVDHVSLLMDVKVLIKTVTSVLKHENIYVTSEK